MTEKERIKEMVGAARVRIGIWDDCPMAREVYLRDVGFLLNAIDKRDDAIKVAIEALNTIVSFEDGSHYICNEAFSKIKAIMGGEKGAGDGKD